MQLEWLSWTSFVITLIEDIVKDRLMNFHTQMKSTIFVYASSTCLYCRRSYFLQTSILSCTTFSLFFLFNWRDFRREEHKEFDTLLYMHSTILLNGSSTMSLPPTVSRVWGCGSSEVLTLSTHPFLLVPNNCQTLTSEKKE